MQKMSRRQFLARLGLFSAGVLAGIGGAAVGIKVIPRGLIGGRPFGLVSISEFGARGNGLDDDTAAIQRAIEEARGRTIIVPPGIHRVSSSLHHVLTDRDLTILGEGEYSILRFEGSTGYALEIDVSQSDPTGVMVSLRELTISGPGMDAGTAVGAVSVTDSSESLGTDEWVFDRVRILDFPGNALVLENAFKHNNSPAVLDSVFRNIGGWAIDALVVHDLRIVGSIFEDANGAIRNQGGPNLTITGNAFDGSNEGSLPAIWLDRCPRGVISGNSIEDYVGAPVIRLSRSQEPPPGGALSDEMDDLAITGNYIGNPLGNDPDQPTILIDGHVRGLVISGNGIYNIDEGYAIDLLEGANGLIIANNEFSHTRAGERYSTRYAGGIRLRPGAHQLTRFKVDGNTLVGVVGGIEVEGGFAGTISSNVLRDPRVEGAGPAILLTDVTDTTVIGNVVHDTRDPALVTYAVEEAGSSNNNIIMGNRARGVLTGAVRKLGASTVAVNNL